MIQELEELVADPLAIASAPQAGRGNYTHRPRTILRATEGYVTTAASWPSIEWISETVFSNPLSTVAISGLLGPPGKAPLDEGKSSSPPWYLPTSQLSAT